MMDAAGTVEPVSVGAGACGVLGGGGDGGLAEGGDADDGAVQAEGDAMWSGDSGSLGGVGVGEASALSGDKGGVEGGKTDAVVGVDGGEVVDGVADGSVADGGVADGGIAGTDRGERSSSLSSSRSRCNSTLFHLRLVLFAGGE
jgi:hypothetical protein